MGTPKIDLNRKLRNEIHQNALDKKKKSRKYIIMSILWGDIIG